MFLHFLKTFKKIEIAKQLNLYKNRKEQISFRVNIPKSTASGKGRFRLLGSGWFQSMHEQT